MDTAISKKRRTGIFLTMIIGMFVCSMATTVTANMIPNFTEQFRVSASLAQWMTSGASLMSAVVIPITAFMIKKLPNKIYFFIALAAYTLGSLLMCTAASFPVLLFFRMMQAFGCGMIIPFAQVVLLSVFPTARHGRVMACYSMASMVSVVVGPTYTGMMLDGVGWRGVFASLSLLGFIILLLGAMFMRNVTPGGTAVLHAGYAALSAAGFVTLIIGVGNISGGELYRLKSGGLIAAGAVLLIIFARLQLRSKSPMLNLRVFKDFYFRIAVAMSIFMYLIAMGTGMILPILAKTICGYSNSFYGYATLAGAVLAVCTTFWAGRTYDKRGIWPMFLIGIILFAGHTALGYRATENISILYIAIVYAAANVAVSMLSSPATAMALSRLSGTLRIDGSAVFNTIRQISSSLASTITVMIFTLAGSDIGAVHAVYIYYGAVTAAVAVTALIYFTGKRRHPQSR